MMLALWYRTVATSESSSAGARGVSVALRSLHYSTVQCTCAIRLIAQHLSPPGAVILLWSGSTVVPDPVPPIYLYSILQLCTLYKCLRRHMYVLCPAVWYHTIS